MSLTIVWWVLIQTCAMNDCQWDMAYREPVPMAEICQLMAMERVATWEDSNLQVVNVVCYPGLALAL